MFYYFFLRFFFSNFFFLFFEFLKKKSVLLFCAVFSSTILFIFLSIRYFLSFLFFKKISLKSVNHHFCVFFKDQQYNGTLEEYKRDLAVSCTLYLGNLSFQTTEEQVWELFREAGEVRRIVMGLDKNKMTPCGFCFVEYYSHEDAQNAVHWLNGLKLDERAIRVDWDPGFKEGRQYGRGKGGGQVRDDHRETYDPGRGGYGTLYRQEESGASSRRKGRDDDDEEDEDRKSSAEDDEKKSKKRERSPEGGEGAQEKEAKEGENNDEGKKEKDDDERELESATKKRAAEGEAE